MKLRCTIFENELVWLRYSSTEGTVDKFNIIKCFIKKSIGNYHRHLTVRFWKWEFYISSNPFQNVIIVSIGRRFFEHYFIEWKYRKSITRLNPTSEQ